MRKAQWFCLRWHYIKQRTPATKRLHTVPLPLISVESYMEISWIRFTGEATHILGTHKNAADFEGVLVYFDVKTILEYQ